MEAAFFDLDKTIIAKSAMLAFGRPLYQAGFLNKRAIMRAMYAQFVFVLVGADEKKMEQVREAMLKLTRGWDQKRMAEIAQDALDEVITPIIYAEAAELISRHKSEGRKVVIISSSPAEVVGPLAHYLGVDEYIATRAKVDDEGRYTGDLDFYAYGPFKAEAIREMAAAEGIDLRESYAYSDSITDVPMLETVGHPVAVNADKELAKYAEEHGWEIRDFRHPVRLRDRVPVPPKGPTIATAVVLGVGGAGIATWLIVRNRKQTALAAAAAAAASEAVAGKSLLERTRIATAASREALQYSLRAARAAQRAVAAVHVGAAAEHAAE
ncbi:MAG: HAD family hydrolase [Acidimicrobiia bacterium]